jgi:hypothetical protein
VVKSTALPKVPIGYRAKSEDPDKCCKLCFYFQPLPDSEDDGKCFGASVSAEGLCDIFTSKREVELSVSSE